jgi:phosphoribosyl-AMP cyclohydrolase / phosphoribosyl-ATP pyrophosphohydrolase
VNEVEFLGTLEQVIEARIRAADEQSYTARLAAAGPLAVAQKLGEEGIETALAAVAETPDRLVAEAADLIYHLLVLLELRGLKFANVVAELERRHRA